MPRQPVVLVRQPDGTLVVLFNRCSHRASTVCLERRGSAHHFRCPYHGWMFRLDGSLIGTMSNFAPAIASACSALLRAPQHGSGGQHHHAA